MKRPGYLAAFLEFWTPRPEIKKVWFSLFTPQVGDQMPEILSSEERARAIADLSELRKQYPKLDMPEAVIRQFSSTPQRPQDCVFALTTQTLSADLRTKITPCQFGGNPDCASCGCIASMGLASSLRTNWEDYFPSEPFSKLPSRLASTERSSEQSINSQRHYRYCKKREKCGNQEPRRN